MDSSPEDWITAKYTCDELIQCQNEDTLAALLRAHKRGVPLAIIFDIRLQDELLISCSTVHGVFHCPSCWIFWQTTLRVLSLCHEKPDYIQAPAVPLSLSDATALTSAVLKFSKLFATDDFVTIYPRLKKALDEDERLEVLYTQPKDKYSRDSRSRFFVFAGGEKGPDGKVYPFATVDENDDFVEGGGLPVAARRLHRLDKSLYQKRAEAEFHRKQKKLDLSADDADTVVSLELVDDSQSVSPSVSCSGEGDGYIVVNVTDNLSFAESGDSSAWAKVSRENISNFQSRKKTMLMKGKNSTATLYDLNEFQTSGSDAAKRKSFILREAEDGSENRQKSSLSYKVFDNLRRLYNTKTEERPLPIAVASLRTGDAGERKGSYGGASTYRFLQDAINPCVWNKTGTPKRLKTLPILKRSREKTAFGIRSYGDEVLCSTSEPPLATSTEVTQPMKQQRSRSAPHNQDKDIEEHNRLNNGLLGTGVILPPPTLPVNTIDQVIARSSGPALSAKEYQDFIERKTKTIASLQEKMRQYELQEIQRLQQNVFMRRPSRTFASNTTMSSAMISSDKTVRYMNSYQTEPSTFDDMLPHIWSNASATTFTTAMSAKTGTTRSKYAPLAESKIANPPQSEENLGRLSRPKTPRDIATETSTHQPYFPAKWKEWLAREYAALESLQEKASAAAAAEGLIPGHRSPKVISPKNSRIKYDAYQRSQLRRKRKTSLLYEPIDRDLVTDNIGIVTGRSIASLSTNTVKDVRSEDGTVCGESRSKVNGELQSITKNASGDSASELNALDSKSDRAAAATKPEIFGSQKYERKSSRYSDFQPDPRLLSSLTFTESFKFSYFKLPSHVKDHNTKIKRGSLWLPMQNLVKKEVIFTKERKISPQPSRLVFPDPSSISVTGTSLGNLMPEVPVTDKSLSLAS